MTNDEIINAVKPYTMVSTERLTQLLNAVEHIVNNNIDGDFIEIGVWKGGCIMAICLKLIQLNKTNKKIFLYDTFQGMSEAEDIDVDLCGETAKNWLKTNDCIASIDEVKINVENTGYPKDLIFYKIGNILETNILEIPKNISLLRLDTDWYNTTKFELENFEPNVCKKGIIIIDDYGHWKGSKKATDEYIDKKQINLNIIDYTGVWWEKI
jgi:hypothetical protein